MVLAEKGIGAVRDAHGDDTHAADHHHGYVDIGKDGHHRCADAEAKSAQYVDNPDAEVKVVQVFLEQS